MPHKHTNRLVHSSSPYLLQHAHNPVDWYPWSEEAFRQAKERDVPVILSIGYSACHWCHVMERESFENEELAAIMNGHFVNIKVDREERPDVDQVYMEALQTMGLQGGWPLNVFLTPDQKPFYGGTYFPPAKWRQVILGVSNAYKENQTQLRDSAEQFARDLSTSELERYGVVPSNEKANENDLKKIVLYLKNSFDQDDGGMQKAPKFPMPSIWKFLLYSNSALKDEDVHGHIELTLDKIARGGIYDQLGGGFARYSVDDEWFAPHFEKMLYDNGQLISLYAEAWRAYPKDLYMRVVYDSIAFLQRELMDASGGFYSALDADSEGREGEYYVWTEAEMKELLGTDYDIVAEYYGVTELGNWEDGRNILHLPYPAEDFPARKNIDQKEWEDTLERANKKLFDRRQHRIRPGLDDKILAGWNGMALRGIVDAYRVFGEKKFLDLALQNATFIDSQMTKSNRIFRNYKNGKADISGYLEDYAYVIDGFMALYQATFDEHWINRARELTDQCLEYFYDAGEKLFFYTASDAEILIARKKELFDNVIPASNSQMAINLHLLSKYFDDEKYAKLAADMLATIKPLFQTGASYLTNWAILYYFDTFDMAEICLAGPETHTHRKEIDKYPVFNKILAGTTNASSLPILLSRTAVNGKSTIYVCFNKSCKLPVHAVEDAIKQLDVGK